MILETAYAVLSLVNILFIGAALRYIIKFRKAKQQVHQMKKATSFPSIAIVVPAYNPDRERLALALSSLKRLNYPKVNLGFYLLDDSENAEVRKANATLCSRHGWAYLGNENDRRTKARALNEFILGAKEELVAIFDSDEVLIDDNFLVDCAAYFEDKRIAVVQAKKDCAAQNIIEKGATITNNMFFNIVQSVESSSGGAGFSGSCGMLRKKAVENVGGFPEIAVEDLGISLALSLKGWKGVFIPKLYALGKATENYARFAYQQKRYILGAIEFARFVLPMQARMGVNEKLRVATHTLGLLYVSLFQLLAIAVMAIIATSNSDGYFLASAMGFFIVPFITTLAMAKACGESIKGTAMSYALNFSIMVERSMQALGALFGAKSSALFEVTLKALLAAVFIPVAYFAPLPEKAVFSLFAAMFLLPAFFMIVYTSKRR